MRPEIASFIIVSMLAEYARPDDDANGNRCGSDYYPCNGSTRCIHSSWVCDGMRDCPEGDDEPVGSECPACPIGQFQCTTDKTCISEEWRCDGRPDCPDRSDESSRLCHISKRQRWSEEGSTTEFRCRPDQYRCPGTTTCISITSLCNAKIDCPVDKADEGYHCTNNNCAKKICPYHDKCRETINGAVCYCKEGFMYDDVTNSCRDMNECAYEDYCDQYCNNSNGSYNCSCVRGYELKKNGTCHALNVPNDKPTTLLVAGADHVRQLSLDGRTLKYFVNKTRIKGLDFNHVNNTVCWLEKSSNVMGKAVIRCSIVSGNDKWTLNMKFRLNGVESMALDWVSRNWYFVDRAIGQIFICKYDGNLCRNIMYVDYPQEIKLDPRFGLMFYTKSGISSKLMRASMDGTNSEILVQKSISRPHGLTLDYAMKHIYWTDRSGNYIRRVDYFGNHSTEIMAGNWVDNIFGLSLLENNIYGTDSANGSVVVFNRFRHAKVAPTILLENANTTSFIQVYHRQRQPMAIGQACETNNGGCDHFCIPSSQAVNSAAVAQCVCEEGFKLQNDGKCVSAMKDEFLLYSSARLKVVRGISTNPTEKSNIIPPIHDLENVVAISYHAVQKHIYYCHVYESVGWIGRRRLDGSSRNDTFIRTGKQCEGLAFDWVGGNIFWTDAALQAILVASVDFPSKRKVLISDNLNHPRAIALDANGGYMYWTDWITSSDSRSTLSILAKIERAQLDGSGREVLISARNVRIYWPGGLALDLVNRRVYWAEAYYDRIQSIPMDGEDRSGQVVLEKNKNLRHPLGLALNGSKLYWSEMSMIVQMDLDSAQVSVIRNDSSSFFDLKFFSQKQQEVNMSLPHTCAAYRAGCSDICVQTAAGPKCLCGAGFKMAAGSDTSCEPDPDYVQNETCLSTEFQCKNDSRCISKSHLCDGTKDCPDGSDEHNFEGGPCYNHTCKEQDVMFKCSNNHCIYRLWLCDGEDDCGSGKKEDEDPEVCKSKTCPTDSYARCNDTGRCIPKEWICDHDFDCNDKSDEPESCREVTCEPDQFQCQNLQCISKVYVCDADYDCKDGSDEANCSINCPDLTHIKCPVTGECLPKVARCNGTSDCIDGSDEEGCDSEEDACDGSEFKCETDGYCIPRSWKCDGTDDCGDGADEKDCGDQPTGHVACQDGFFGCNSTSGHYMCFANEQKCDGFQDCLDNSDEDPPNETCVIQKVCNERQYDCYTGKPRCIDLMKTCDEKPDCQFGQDEGILCSIKYCEVMGTCSHTCHNTPNGMRCSCPRGLKLDTDDRNCISSGVPLCEVASECSHMCNDTEEGMRCSCPAGMALDVEGKTCIADVCQWGTCGQTCRAAFNYDSYKPLCGCNPGFRLEPDGFNCKAIDTSPAYLIFSNRHEMRRVMIGDEVQEGHVSLVSGLPNTIALDFHYQKNTLFWTDVVDDQISRGTMISNTLNNIEPIVKVGLATAEGLAVDWIGNNIYWVESNLDQIEVARLNGSMRTTLVAGNMDSPRAIVLDPRFGVLFWSDWHSDRPRIERVSMSGDNRKCIVDIRKIDGAGWPNGMTLDYESVRLYWIDARSDSIHSVDYDGNDQRLILRDYQKLFHPFAITTFGNYVYWTDWSTNALIRANKWNGSDVMIVSQTMTQPFDVHVYHSTRQPNATNPCAKDNGQCSHLCLFNHSGAARCRCPYLMKLTEDGKTCEKNERFLLYAKPNEIRGVDLDQPYYSVIPSLTSPHIKQPLAVDFDVKEKRLYWTDQELHIINRVYLDLSDIETVTDSGIWNPHGFAIDWLSRNMYFATYNDDTVKGKVSVSRLDGAYRDDIITEGLDKPTSIAVHPVKGKLFIADTGRLLSANMDGSNLTTLFNSVQQQITAKSLCVDMTTNRLYWINGATGSIDYCQLDDCRQRQSIQPRRGSVKVPSVMTVYKDEIYYADETKIWKISTKGGNASMIRNNTLSVKSIKIYDPSLRTGTNPCSVNNGGCSQLCLPVKFSRVCRCTPGYELDTNKLSCRGLRSFLLYSTHMNIYGSYVSDPSQKVLPPISSISDVVAIDFHAEESYIYWVNSKSSTISRIRRDLTQREVVVKDGLGGVEGLAVDWSAGNLYWTDQGFNTISVSRANGSDRFVVLSKDIDKPRSIVVHPKKGLMFWSDVSNRPRIEAARLDGSQRRELVNVSIGNPYSITLDLDEDRLYWCDKEKKLIERVFINGTGRQIVLRSVIDCTSLVVSGSDILWMEVATPHGSIKKALKNNGTKETVVLDDLTEILMDMKMFDSQRQKDMNNCHNDNDGCQDLCFYLGEARTQCACSHGKLTADEKTCSDYDAFVLYSSISSIEGINLFDPEDKNPPIKPIRNETHLKNVIGLAFDFDTKTIFFSDLQRGDIQQVNFDGTDIRTVVTGVGSAEGIAFNSVFRELYWTSYSNSSINRVSFGHAKTGPFGTPTSSLPRETVVQLHTEDHPRAIVLDTCASRMFWTNWNPKKPSIQTAYLGGWHVKPIITTAIKVPNGLVIDHKGQKLYWSDAGLDKIERCDFDGSNRKVILSVVPQHIFGMALYGDMLFWTDWVMRSIMMASKYDGSGLTALRKVSSQPMGIAAVANDTNNCHLNPCLVNNGGCVGTCTVNEYGVVVCNCSKDGSCPNANVTCLWDDFKCTDGTCISMELTCDGLRNCSDGSDEFPGYCKHRTCPKNYYHCDNNHCIKWYKYCNQYDDCGDNSDEQDCTCPPGNFLCSSRTTHCIPGSHRCDHHPDCPNGEDETHCDPVDCNTYTYHGRETLGLISCNTTTACISPSWICDSENDCWDNSDEENHNCTTTSSTADCGSDFKCLKSEKCIPSSWVCDHGVDCEDGSDEMGCDFTCSSKQFKCVNDSLCIPSSWKCDGSVDCNDGSDEPQDCKIISCINGYFKCEKSGRCINKEWVCDGEVDCPDGEDEMSGAQCVPKPCKSDEWQCRNYNCIPYKFYCDHYDDCGDGSDESSECEYPTCSSTDFQCNSGQCIPLGQKCDGDFNCFDHSDESLQTCPPKNTCDLETEFKCRNGKCINIKEACDGKNTCGDWSDEQYCHKNMCRDGILNPCEHICKDLVAGYECACLHGYKLQENNRSCENINECLDLPCSHYCHDRYGGFTCSCAAGFQLGNDKKSCKVKSGPEPRVIVTNRYYIRNISISGESILMTKALSNAVALDFDWLEQRLYWSDVTSTGSNISRMFFNTSDPTPEVIHHSTLRNPDGMALDWLGRNIYWCDKTTDTIEVSRLDGSFRKVLVNRGLLEPRAIAVHPARGYLFYSDWGENAHIGRMGMDGSGRKNIITERLGWPNALTLDFVTDHIFWGDARLDYIKVADLDGQNKRVVVSEGLPHIFALSQFGDYIYWTDWEFKSIERAHKFTGEDRKTLSAMIHRPMDIQVINPYRQRPSKTNPCLNNGHCGNLCLIKPGGKERVCACPENHYLAADGRTCISNCTSSQFKCHSTFKCIPNWNKCDGHDDCGDGSDEPSTCPPYLCPERNMFQCAFSRNQSYFMCIPPSQICDGIDQCRQDKSDEMNCAQYTCLTNQFKCHKDPRCISSAQRCDGREDCLSGEDEKDCPKVSCPPTKLMCNSGRCIPYVWRCDRANDCGDLSDEPENCLNLTCREGYFQCKTTGQCVPNKWKCDGEPDCGPKDYTDEPEDECKNATCDATYFKCKNNRCIPGRWRCDYSDDCGDGSDEENCAPRKCSESEFACSADKRCIPHHWVCNGETDCDDGSDEKACVPAECDPDTKFQCNSTKYCIPKTWQCDEQIDCSDGSDEAGCNKTCDIGEFQCKNGICIPELWKCDGTDDCEDNSDETKETCREHICQVGGFRCDNGACVLPSEICDGIQHCEDNSDEKNCTARGCNSHQYQCKFSDQCISVDRVCDKFLDCADGTDEDASLCIAVRDCQECEYNCTKIGRGHQCSCPNGKELDVDAKHCKAVNKCELWKTCEQKCYQITADHDAKCLCAEGYEEDLGAVNNKDLPICKAQGSRPYLLITREDWIRSLSLMDLRATQVIYKRLEKLGAVDIYVNRKAKGTESNVSIFLATQQQQPPSIYIVTFNDKFIVRVKRELNMRTKRELNMRTKREIKLEDAKEIRGIAFDWVGKRIYWTDPVQDKIEMMGVDGKNRKTIVSTNLDQPQRIVVDPASLRIFWTDWGVNAKIESAHLDGSDRKVIVSHDLLWPTGLAIDYPNGRLYFSDTKKGTIETTNLDGSDRHLVKKFKRSEDRPYMMDIFENFLYVTTYKNHDLFKLNKFNQSEAVYLRRNMGPIGDFVLVQENKQSADILDTCNPLVCGKNAICVRLPYPKYYSCLCPDGAHKNGSDCILHEATLEPKECPPDHCANGGTCQMSENNVPKCSCPPQFYGDYCQNDRCYNYCLNDGKCVANYQREISCQCPLAFQGDRCQFPKCIHYCQNNGRCSVLPTGMAVCQCSYSYKGPRCETQREDLCQDYCKNDAECKVENGRPKCICQSGFEGQQCEQCVGYTCAYGGICYIDSNKTKACHCKEGLSPLYQCNETLCKDYCFNNGTCKTNSEWQPVCKCPPRYSPPRCEEEKCLNYCKNGGTCSYDEVTSQPVCKCQSSFRGTTCEQRVATCLAGFCKNGGTCKLEKTQNGNQPTCICPNKYSGSNCEIAPGCDRMVCKNHGVCTFDEKTQLAKCRCTSFWTGDDCSLPSSLQCKNYCFNNGTCLGCIVTKDNYKCHVCICQSGWTGDRCSERITRIPNKGGQKSPGTVAAITVPIILCLIIIAVIGACLYKRKHLNKQFLHARLEDNSNVEISNPIYHAGMEEENTIEIDQPFSLDSKATNFSNPMYESMFSEGASAVPNDERKELLENDQLKAHFGDDDDDPSNSFA